MLTEAYYAQNYYAIPIIHRPTASVLLKEIKGLTKKYEDDLDAIQGKTKLALLDEIQGNGRQANSEQSHNPEDSISRVQVS